MINRELHTCLTFYRSTPWLISKTLNLFTNLNRFIYNIYTSLPNSSWNAVAPWSTLGAPDVWCLYRLSTRTNRRATYFFCQKYYKSHLRKNTIHERRKTLFTVRWIYWFTINAKTEIPRSPQTLFTNPQKHYSKTRKIIREIRTTFFKLSDWSDLRFWISKLFSHPTPLFIAFLNLHNFNLFTKMPPLKGEVGLGVKWPFYPLAF